MPQTRAKRKNKSTEAGKPKKAAKLNAKVKPNDKGKPEVLESEETAYDRVYIKMIENRKKQNPRYDNRRNT